MHASVISYSEWIPRRIFQASVAKNEVRILPFTNAFYDGCLQASQTFRGAFSEAAKFPNVPGKRKENAGHFWLSSWLQLCDCNDGTSQSFLQLQLKTDQK